MSKFIEELAALKDKKVRFYTGGGDSGFIQGPVIKVEGDLVYIEKEGAIRGTRHGITIQAGHIRYFEIEIVTQTKD
ncbi:MAG: hypothetical protein ACYTGV_02765 [Planctomycetota bacterium]|jgi:hypothetical protein